MSNKVKILIFLLSVSLVFSQLYIYITNKSICNQIKNNEDLHDEIVEIDKFKIDIIDMSISSKYFIWTSKDKYKISFDKNYNSVIVDLDDLYNSNYITKNDKTSLEEILDRYNNLTYDTSISAKEKGFTVSDDIEKSMLILTDIEKSLINDTSEALSKKMDSSKTTSYEMINIVDTQNNLIQIIGGFITMIFLSPIYFLKRNSGVLIEAIKTFITNHLKKNIIKDTPKANDINNNLNSNSSECNDKMIKCINEGIINNLENMFAEREVMISTLKIVKSHNEYMQKEWIKGRESLDSIEKDLLDLKKELNILMSKSDIPYEKINILENKLLEIRFLLEKLPQYHEFITNLIQKY